MGGLLEGEGEKGGEKSRYAPAFTLFAPFPPPASAAGATGGEKKAEGENGEPRWRNWDKRIMTRRRVTLHCA